MAPKLFTKDELAKYDGSDASKVVLLSVRGYVYDVSPGRDFYGAGGPYNVFAGTECARALALMSTSADDCNDNLAGIDDKSMQTLKEWESKFQGKYRVVGAMEGSGIDLSAYDFSEAPATSVAKAPNPKKGQNLPLLLSLAGVVVAGMGMWVSSQHMAAMQ